MAVHGQGKQQQQQSSIVSPLLLVCVIIPVSLFFWLGHRLVKSFSDDGESFVDDVHISPTKCLVAVTSTILTAVYGYKRKSLDKSGALSGLVLGFTLVISNGAFGMSMFMFFLTASWATKVRGHQKRKFEHDYKEGGQRNWIQVLCNAGVAMELALMYILDCQCAEQTIDFHKRYRCSWLSLGFLGAISCCNGDTWASELGTVFGSMQPILITTGKKVPKGTNGGITLSGCTFSLIGGLVIGVSYYLTLINMVDTVVLERSPPQWPLIIMGGLGGLIGSLIDSLLGATLQFSGVDTKTGFIVEERGPGVKHISGIPALDNHSVNFLSSCISAFLLPKLAIILWPLFG